MNKPAKPKIDIVDKLLSYNAASGYARHMFAAAEEIIRLRAENEAWRERFQTYHYRPQDDCIALK